MRYIDTLLHNLKVFYHRIILYVYFYTYPTSFKNSNAIEQMLLLSIVHSLLVRRIKILR